VVSGAAALISINHAPEDSQHHPQHHYDMQHQGEPPLIPRVSSSLRS
jgi:hypothetical protein